MTETLEPLLSVNEASRILGVSRNTTWRRIYEGLLPGIKLGGRVLVHPDDLRAYIATGRRVGWGSERS